MDTTEDLSVRFDAVSDDTAIAVWANRRQGVDCALEAVESVTLSAHDDFKRLVIFVLANFACRHTQFVRARGGSVDPAGITDAGYNCALRKFFWS